jgi:hypothetical protein
MGASLDTAAGKLSLEVAKHEAWLRDRAARLLQHVGADSDASVVAALDDEAVLIEGDLLKFRDALARAEAGETVEAGELIAGAIEERTAEARAAGYPELPSDAYFYRTWGGGGPEGQQFQIVRRAGARADLPLVQPRRVGAGWVLGESEGSRVPTLFGAALGDQQVLTQLRAQSPTLRAYEQALVKQVGLAQADVDARIEQAVAKLRAKRPAGVDEDTLRHALKEEFRKDFFDQAARRATPEERVVFMREATRGLGSSDKGSIMEEFLGDLDPVAKQHVHVSQQDLAAQGIEVDKDRILDRLHPDGTSTEVKSGATKVNPDAYKQLRDTVTMRDKQATIKLGEKVVHIDEIVYEFPDYRGALNNEAFIQEAFEKECSVRVISKSGTTKNFTASDGYRAIQEFAPT